MGEADILRIQTNLQITTALFAIVFLLMYIAFQFKGSRTVEWRASGHKVR